MTHKPFMPLRPMVELALANHTEKHRLGEDSVTALRFIIAWKNEHPSARPYMVCDAGGTPSQCNGDAERLVQAAAVNGVHLTIPALAERLHDAANIEQIFRLLEGPRGAKYVERLRGP